MGEEVYCFTISLIAVHLVDLVIEAQFPGRDLSVLGELKQPAIECSPIAWD
jgi:hypothetical protein